jgi:N utilization substance protein A
MDSRTLIESFSDFAKLKNIDRPTMIKILEEVFRSILRKKYVEDTNFDVIINIDKGDLEIWRFREVVDDESEDIWDYDKIPFAEAIKIQSDLAVGDELAEEINIEDDFGRRGILTAKQTLVQKVKDLEKEKVSVEVSIFGRPTNVDLNFLQITKIN